MLNIAFDVAFLAALAIASPIAQNAQASASAAVTARSTYNVLEGDTCDTIAQKSSVSFYALGKLNNLNCSEGVESGIVIKLPNPCVTYRTKLDDTCWRLSKIRQISYAQVFTLNPGLDPACRDLQTNVTVCVGDAPASRPAVLPSAAGPLPINQPPVAAAPVVSSSAVVAAIPAATSTTLAASPVLPTAPVAPIAPVVLEPLVPAVLPTATTKVSAVTALAPSAVNLVAPERTGIQAAFVPAMTGVAAAGSLEMGPLIPESSASAPTTTASTSAKVGGIPRPTSTSAAGNNPAAMIVPVPTNTANAAQAPQPLVATSP